MPAISRVKKVLICLAIWVIPLTTGCIAVALGVMMPAGANWCWISAARTDLRYALSHGWRFVIIAAIICIYGYVYWYMSRHFKSLAATEARSSNYYSYNNNNNSMVTGHSRTDSRPSMQKHPYAMHVVAEEQESRSRTPDVLVLQQPGRCLDNRRDVVGRSWLRLSSQRSSSSEHHKDFPQPPDSAVAKENISIQPGAVGDFADGSGEDPYYIVGTQNMHLARSGTMGTSDTLSTCTHTLARVETQKSPRATRVKREVQKMLLLNAYPILYVLLWIPALVNRLLQAANHETSSRLLDALQTSSAFIGLANGITYGFNQQLRRLISRDISYWWARRGWSQNKSRGIRT